MPPHPLPQGEALSGVDFSSLLPERECEYPSWKGQGVGKKGSESHEAPEPTPNLSLEGYLAASP